MQTFQKQQSNFIFQCFLTMLSKDKSTTSSKHSQALAKTQLPPKNSTKESLNSIQSNQPHLTVASSTKTASIKKIQSTKQLPRQGLDFDIKNNMTESKILTAKQSLQLLKKKMGKSAMSRQKFPGSSSSQNIPTSPSTKVLEKTESMKQIKPKSNKNISSNQAPRNGKNYEQNFANSKISQESNNSKSNSKKVPLQQQKSLQKKKIQLPPPKTQSFTNQRQEIQVGKKQTFEQMLQRQLKKQQAARKKLNSNDHDVNNKNKIKNSNLSEFPEQAGQLFECSKGCGRQFNANSISKHEKICEKVFQKKRKAFDTAAQRQVQIEGFQNKPQMTQKTESKKPAEKKKVPKWKLQSAQLRVGLKATKNEEPTEQEKQLADMRADQLVPCNYCGRKFNQQAAQRHIPLCQKKAKQAPRLSNNKKK